MCNNIDDFFEFLGFQDVMKKSNVINNDGVNEPNNNINISNNFEKSEYPYGRTFDENDD